MMRMFLAAGVLSLATGMPFLLLQDAASRGKKEQPRTGGEAAKDRTVVESIEIELPTLEDTVDGLARYQGVLLRRLRRLEERVAELEEEAGSAAIPRSRSQRFGCCRCCPYGRGGRLVPGVRHVPAIPEELSPEEDIQIGDEVPSEAPPPDPKTPEP